MKLPSSIDDLNRDELLSLIRHREEILGSDLEHGISWVRVENVRLTERDIIRAKWVVTHERAISCAQRERAAEEAYHVRLRGWAAAQAAFQKALEARSPRARLDQLARAERTARRLSDDADDDRQKIRRQLDRLHQQTDALWDRMEALKK